jgi:hypothetical protein
MFTATSGGEADSISSMVSAAIYSTTDLPPVVLAADSILGWQALARHWHIPRCTDHVHDQFDSKPR